MKKHTKQTSFFSGMALVFTMLLALLFTGTPQELSAQSPDYQRRFLYCTFPLKKGEMWRYDIFKDNVKAGELGVKVEGYTLVKANNLSEYMSENSYYSQIPLYTVQYEDTYLNKNYTKKILFSIDAYYIYDEKTRNYIPFLKSYMRPGDRYNDLIVVRAGDETFNGDNALVATLRSTKDPTYQERYMDYIGLYYYRKGDVEYKLTSYQKMGQPREMCADYDRVDNGSP